MSGGSSDIAELCFTRERVQHTSFFLVLSSNLMEEMRTWKTLFHFFFFVYGQKPTLPRTGNKNKIWHGLNVLCSTATEPRTLEECWFFFHFYFLTIYFLAIDHFVFAAGDVLAALKENDITSWVWCGDQFLRIEQIVLQKPPIDLQPHIFQVGNYCLWLLKSLVKLHIICEIILQLREKDTSNCSRPRYCPYGILPRHSHV